MSSEFSAARTGPSATRAATRVKPQRLRQAIPWHQPASERQAWPLGMVAYDFMQENPASKFYSGGPQPPATAALPSAGVLP